MLIGLSVILSSYVVFKYVFDKQRYASWHDSVTWLCIMKYTPFALDGRVAYVRGRSIWYRHQSVRCYVRHWHWLKLSAVTRWRGDGRSSGCHRIPAATVPVFEMWGRCSCLRIRTSLYDVFINWLSDGVLHSEMRTNIQPFNVPISYCAKFDVASLLVMH